LTSDSASVHDLPCKMTAFLSSKQACHRQLLWYVCAV